LTRKVVEAGGELTRPLRPDFGIDMSGDAARVCFPLGENLLAA